nr:protein-glutamate O-methyltransferase CheR [uncultured Desulfobacter sp.]
MDTQKIEINLLFEALKQRYGYDFKDYSFETARRRVLQQVALMELDSINSLQRLILNNSDAADGLVKALSINVTEMFRDPEFFLILRNRIMPRLTGRDHLKIWHAGCASGEEVYSMAILLKEEGLYEQTTIYGTDFNGPILDTAKAGIIPMGQMKKNIYNYQGGGGSRDFADYYHARYEGVVLSSALKKNIVFSLHDLARDDAFGTFEMIICRNVLIYFNHRLKDRVFKLFKDSLGTGGYLCLGSHESIPAGRFNKYFKVIDADMKIYQKTAN